MPAIQLSKNVQPVGWNETEFKAVGNPVTGALFVEMQAASTVLGKVGIDQTTPGTTDSVTVKSTGHSNTVTITRPATTPTYTAGQLIGDANGSAIFAFANMGKAGGEVMITSMELQVDVGTVPTGMSGFTVRLFNASPTAVADAAAWDIPVADRGKYIGKVALGTPVKEGATLFIENDGINKQIKMVSTTLYVALQTVGGYPATSGAVKHLTIHTLDL
jgi:hypothetical protein